MSNKTNNGVVGFFGLLAILFTWLKIANLITWSWWWVTAPLWGPAVLIVVVCLVAEAIAIKNQKKT